MRVKLMTNFVFNLGKGKTKTLIKGVYDSDQKPFPKELVEEIKRDRRVIQVLSGSVNDVKEMTTLDDTSKNLETSEKKASDTKKSGLKRKKK